MSRPQTRPVRVECVKTGRDYEARWETAAADAICVQCGATIPTKGSVRHPVTGAGRGRP